MVTSRSPPYAPPYAPLRALLRGWAFLLCACLVVAGGAFAAEGDIAPVPALTKRVTDQTGSLSAAEEAKIEADVKTFEARKGAQIAVLIVATTQPEAIFDYSFRVAEAWKLGRKGVDDGVLFVVAKNDRKMQIITGPGISGVLTDAMSKRIISEIVAPKFRANDFAGGIGAGVSKIIGLIDGEALPPPAERRQGAKGAGVGIETFLAICFFAVVGIGPLVRALLGRILGSSAMGGVTGAAAWFIWGGLLAPLAIGIPVFLIVLLFLGSSGGRGGGMGGGGWSSGGGGWSGGGGSSDGGGFSGGGGSFDGGGASGDW